MKIYTKKIKWQEVLNCHTGRSEMKKDLTHIDQKLLILYLLDEISQQGRAKVEAWLAESEENRAHFESFRKTWEAAATVEAVAVAFDTNRAWDKVSGRIGRSEDVKDVMGVTDVTGGRDAYLRPVSPNGKNVKRVMNFRIGGLTQWFIWAAAALLVLGIISVLFVRNLQTSQETGMVTLASVAAPVQDTLNDGTAVVLNGKTTLTVPKKFELHKRSVKLSGEAFFQVTHDSARPFVINAGIGQVKVLGTSFHVRAFPDADLEVYVESGRVELSATDSARSDSPKIVLKAGERGMIRMGTNSIVKPAEIGPDELFWANRKLIFQETKLSLVFDLLKKHYDADIEVKDTAILNCLLSATFTDEPVEQILEVVAASFELKVSREKEKFIVNGKGCTDEK